MTTFYIQCDAWRQFDTHEQPCKCWKICDFLHGPYYLCAECYEGIQRSDPNVWLNTAPGHAYQYLKYRGILR